MTRQNLLLTAGPLFLVLFIDGMGLGLVFPVLNALVMDPHAHFIAASTSANARSIIFGAIIGTFMLCWFFGTAFLGDLSDQIGRKKSLLICLLGSFIGYALSALAVMFNMFWLLIVGRVIAGFTAGSQPIAQAAIVDISSEEHKARNIGWILLSVSLGFIFGPMLGGFFSDHDLFAGFNYATPFIFAAVISLFNALLLQLLFKESFQRNSKVSLKLHRALEVFVSAFKHPRIRSLSYIFLVFIFGWSSFYSFIPLFLLKEYHFTTMHTGLFMGAMGVGFGLGTGILVEYFTKRFSLKYITIVSLLLTALFVLGTLCVRTVFFASLCIVPIGAMAALAYSVLTTMFSNQVDASAQGWVMGITGAIMAFAFGINGFLTGALANQGIGFPLLMAIVGLLLSAILMYFLYHENVSST